MLFNVIKRVIYYWNPAGITQPPEVLYIHLSVSVSVSFFMFPCSKGHLARAYLDSRGVYRCLIFEMSIWEFITNS